MERLLEQRRLRPLLDEFHRRVDVEVVRDEELPRALPGGEAAAAFFFSPGDAFFPTHAYTTPPATNTNTSSVFSASRFRGTSVTSVILERPRVRLVREVEEPRLRAAEDDVVRPALLRGFDPRARDVVAPQRGEELLQPVLVRAAELLEREHGGLPAVLLALDLQDHVQRLGLLRAARPRAVPLRQSLPGVEDERVARVERRDGHRDVHHPDVLPAALDVQQPRFVRVAVDVDERGVHAALEVADAVGEELEELARLARLRLAELRRDVAQELVELHRQQRRRAGLVPRALVPDPEVRVVRDRALELERVQDDVRVADVELTPELEPGRLLHGLHRLDAPRLHAGPRTRAREQLRGGHVARDEGGRGSRTARRERERLSGGESGRWGKGGDLRERSRSTRVLGGPPTAGEISIARGGRPGGRE